MGKKTLLILSLFLLPLGACHKKQSRSDMNIIFLHHSTGEFIWNGRPRSIPDRALRKINKKLASAFRREGLIPSLMKEYNKSNGKNYKIREVEFPKEKPYGWNNNPYDYYNIWVKNAGEIPFKEEPTLEMLTKDFQVIIFKHCYPVSNIKSDQDTTDINSWKSTISNYQLQYNALKEKLHEFPGSKFILFTGAVHTKANLPEDEAIRAKNFFDWVRNEWDEPNDNIFLWDYYELATEGGLYLKDEYAMSPTDSHPNRDFSRRVGKLLFSRIIDVIENNGETTLITGESE